MELYVYDYVPEVEDYDDQGKGGFPRLSVFTSFPVNYDYSHLLSFVYISKRKNDECLFGLLLENDTRIMFLV